LNLNLWSRFDLALVTPCPKPPAGERWLHEIKHDPVLGRFRLAMVVDGEIAGPDERGITHISELHDALLAGSRSIWRSWPSTQSGRGFFCSGFRC
jgi:hypothetical protein